MGEPTFRGEPKALVGPRIRVGGLGMGGPRIERSLEWESPPSGVSPRRWWGTGLG